MDSLIKMGSWDIEMSRNWVQQIFESKEDPQKPIKRKKFENENFTQTVNLKEMLRGVFINCSFIDTLFDNFDCSDYVLNCCKIESNKANNSSFDFLGMIDCDIYNSSFSNSSFNNSILKSINLSNSNIQACDFQNCIVINSKIQDTIISCSDFKGSIIENCLFNSVDLKDTDLQYMEFRGDILVKDSSFLMQDILHCFNGISMIEKNKDRIFLKLSDKSKSISGELFLSSVDKMIGYFVSIYDYFAVANIMIFLGDKQSAFETIMLGIKYNLAQRDFKLIHYLCKLAAISSIFSTSNLKQIYNFLKSNSILFELSQFEYKRYMNEVTAIKQMLIDNPSDLAQMRISLITLIDENDYEKLSHILKLIDDIAFLLIPQTSKSVTIRHNSSPIIEILLSDSICMLIPYFALLCAVVGKSIQYIDKILDLIKKHEEIIGNKLSNKKTKLEISELNLNNQLKEIEVKKSKYEYEQMLINTKRTKESFEEQSKQTNVNATYISTISYNILSNQTEINEEYRQMQMDFNQK